jgi:hypothetical protein
MRPSASAAKVRVNRISSVVPSDIRRCTVRSVTRSAAAISAVVSRNGISRSRRAASGNRAERNSTSSVAAAYSIA